MLLARGDAGRQRSGARAQRAAGEAGASRERESHAERRAASGREQPSPARVFLPGFIRSSVAPAWLSFEEKEQERAQEKQNESCMRPGTFCGVMVPRSARVLCSALAVA